MAIKGRDLGGPPPLFLDQTEAQRAEKMFLETSYPPTPLSKGLDDQPPPPPPPHLFRGLDLALIRIIITITKFSNLIGYQLP